jgi:hypothetical protein
MLFMILLIMLLFVLATMAGTLKPLISIQKPAPTATPVPTAPGHLAAGVTPDRRIRLTWQDPYSGKTRFSIERKSIGAGPYVEIDQTGPGKTEFKDGAVHSGIIYYYRFRAFVVLNNTKRFSDYSNEVNIKMTGPAVQVNAFSPVIITTAPLSVVAITPVTNTAPFTPATITTATLSVVAITPVPNTAPFTPLTITTQPLTVIVKEQ